MRTNIVLNDALVAEAFKYSANIHTKKELVEVALQEYIQKRKVKDIRDLKGKIDFYENYNYKEMRIENDLYLLHDDNDFINMAKVIKELKLYE